MENKELNEDNTLVEEVKPCVGVSDSSFDKDLLRYINSSIEYFKLRVSPRFDINDDYSKSILFDRVRYQFNNSLNEFESDFINELLNLEDYYEQKETTGI